MFRDKEEVSAFDRQLDRDLIARMNEARSSDELSLLTKTAVARLRGRAPKTFIMLKQRAGLRAVALRSE